MIAVSLPDELLKRLDDAVDKTGKKRSFLIRESISMYLNNIENIHEKKEIILNTSKPFYEVLIEEFKNEKKLITEARKTEFTMFSDNGKLYVINSKGNTPVTIHYNIYFLLLIKKIIIYGCPYLVPGISNADKPVVP